MQLLIGFGCGMIVTSIIWFVIFITFASQSQLVKYSAELKLGETITLDELIKSHRHLRSLNLEMNDRWSAAIAESALKGEHAARDLALKEGWFSREKLRSMSLEELSNYLVDEK
jgi:hypothetical protein